MDKQAKLAIANQTLQAELTSCKQEIEALRSQLDLCTTILNTVSALVVVFDAEGHIVRSNSSYEQTTGYKFDQVRNQPFWDTFVIPQEKETVKAVFEKIQVDKLAQAHEQDWITKDGSRHIAWSYTPFLNSDSTVKYVIAHGSDITLQKQMETELKRLREALEMRTQEVAIACEQEKAIQERAVQLAKANDALKRSLDSLAQQPELQAFLQRVVEEASAQTGAAHGALFVYDEQMHSLSLSVAIDNKGDWPSVTNMEQWKRPFPSDITPLWDTLVRSKTPLVLDVDGQNSELAWPGALSWLRKRGFTRTICAVLWLGSKPLGYLGLAFREDTNFIPQKVELVQALTQQATLAIQLTRLAEASRQNAVLDERNRMAREIHDTLAQAFTGIVVHQEAAKRILTAEQEDVREHINWTLRLAREGLKDARRSVWALREPPSKESTLPNRLARLVEQMTNGLPVEVMFSLRGTLCSLLEDVESNLLHICQEALTNALRHAEPKHIHIELIFESQQVRLRVQDDGQGFASKSSSKIRSTSGRGFGLLGMQERAEGLGGQLTITSQPRKGTEVVVQVPLLQS